MDTPRITVETLKTVIESLCSAADDARKETDFYKDMFEASEKGLRGALSKANDEMVRVALTTTQILEEKFGIKATNDIFYTVMALPFAWEVLERDISDKEGSCCSVDKVRELYYRHLLAMITRNKDASDE